MTDQTANKRRALPALLAAAVAVLAGPGALPGSAAAAELGASEAPMRLNIMPQIAILRQDNSDFTGVGWGLRSDVSIPWVDVADGVAFITYGEFNMQSVENRRRFIFFSPDTLQEELLIYEAPELRLSTNLGLGVEYLAYEDESMGSVSLRGGLGLNATVFETTQVGTNLLGPRIDLAALLDHDMVLASAQVGLAFDVDDREVGKDRLGTPGFVWDILIKAGYRIVDPLAVGLGYGIEGVNHDNGSRYAHTILLAVTGAF